MEVKPNVVISYGVERQRTLEKRLKNMKNKDKDKGKDKNKNKSNNKDKSKKKK